MFVITQCHGVHVQGLGQKRGAHTELGRAALEELYSGSGLMLDSLWLTTHIRFLIIKAGHSYSF